MPAHATFGWRHVRSFRVSGPYQSDWMYNHFGVRWLIRWKPLPSGRIFARFSLLAVDSNTIHFLSGDQLGLLP
jgi:hypothetical protein